MIKNIAFITDMHLDETFPKTVGVDAYKNLQIVLQDLKKHDVDTIIIGGDIGESNVVAPFINQLHDYNVYIILGNHDRYADTAEFIDNIKNEGKDELFYHVELENHQLIFMDSSSEKVSDVQLQWLDQQLITDKIILLFIHHPVLAVNTAIDRLYPLKNREIVRSRIQHLSKTITIFCGHYHMAENTKFNSNIIQYITPAVSYQVKKNDSIIKTTNTFFGYRIIRLGGVALQTELVIFE